MNCLRWICSKSILHSRNNNQMPFRTTNHSGQCVSEVVFTEFLVNKSLSVVMKVASYWKFGKIQSLFGLIIVDGGWTSLSSDQLFQNFLKGSKSFFCFFHSRGRRQLLWKPVSNRIEAVEVTRRRRRRWRRRWRLWRSRTTSSFTLVAFSRCHAISPTVWCANVSCLAMT